MKKILLSLILLSVTLSTTFAQDKEAAPHWDYSLTTDIVVYPLPDFIPGESHYSKIVGYDLSAFRITGAADYVIPTPLGEHWLLSDAFVQIEPAVEFTAVSLKGIFSTTFQPVPFLEFQAGASIGTGWNFGSVNAFQSYNENTNKYENLTPFKNYYYELWGKGTFMFDTGALIPGDWTHVVMLAEYKLMYSGMTGLQKNQPFNWLTAPGQMNGLQYDTQFILAYQMPLVVYRAGSMFEFYGHYNGNDYGKYNESFNGEFTTAKISPFVQFKFNEKNTVTFLTEFSTRRSFAEDHNSILEEMPLHHSGNEWFINFFGVSWTYNF